MPKKLKKVVKSLYSHEIRKDVDLSALHTLKLEDAWPFMRAEIEAEVGSNQLVCIPHVTEAELYTVTSLFVQDGADAPLSPLGRLADLLSARVAPEVKLAAAADLTDTHFKFPHDSVKITLQDESIKHKVRVIMVRLTRAAATPDLLHAALSLDLSARPYLLERAATGAVSVLLVSSALRVGTLEFRVTVGSSSRIFHLCSPTPLVFSLHRYQLQPDGRLVSKGPVCTRDQPLRWERQDSADHLYTTDRADAALYQ